MRITPPNHTQTPNDLFDHWLPHLNESELKVLLVVIRKTFGWHKPADRISLSQLQRITGLCETSVLGAIKSLISKGVISKETVGPVGKQQSFYALVVEESNNLYPPSNCGGTPPDNWGGRPPQIIGDTKETPLTKETAAAKESKPAAAFLEIYPELKDVDIPESDKLEITNRNPIESVRNAIAWATHPQTKINKTLAQAIKWACQNKPEVPKTAKDVSLDNKTYSAQFAGRRNSFASFEMLNDGIEIDYVGEKAPFGLKYEDNGFKQQLENALRKCDLWLKK